MSTLLNIYAEECEMVHINLDSHR